jgi:hypothetical protein
MHSPPRDRLAGLGSETSGMEWLLETLRCVFLKGFAPFRRMERRAEVEGGIPKGIRVPRSFEMLKP